MRATELVLTYVSNVAQDASIDPEDILLNIHCLSGTEKTSIKPTNADPISKTYSTSKTLQLTKELQSQLKSRLVHLHVEIY